MIEQLLYTSRKIVMKIHKFLTAHNRGAIISHEDEKIKHEKLERQILSQRIRAMDAEIDNIGRRQRGQ